MNRELYIGKRMFVNSTNYYNGQIFETGRSVCNGLTEDQTQFRFGSPAKDPTCMDLGCIFTRHKDQVFINLEILEKYIKESLECIDKKIKFDKYCVVLNINTLKIELYGMNKIKDKFTGEEFYESYNRDSYKCIELPIGKKTGTFKDYNSLLNYYLYDEIDEAILRIAELISNHSFFNLMGNEKKNTKIFKFPVEWAVYSTIEIEAETLEEGLEIANQTIDDIPFPTDPNNVDGSFALCKAKDGSSKEEDLEYYKLFN